MKKNAPLTESASSLDAAHHNLVNARRNVDRQRKLFMAAQITRQKAQSEFDTLKDSHEQKTIETV